MTAAAIFHRLDDALNPIVVKELRQSVQSRFVTIVLSLFLLLEVLVIGGVLLSSTQDRLDPGAGRGVFVILHGIVLATCLLFVPVYTGARLAAERSDTNVDLLFITAIRPRSIVWGKFWSGVLLAALIYSACLPFLTLTYLLRGVDLVAVWVIVVADWGVIMASIMLAIFIACMGLNRIVKMLLALAAAGGLFGVFIGMMEMSDEMMRYGTAMWIGANDFWVVAGLCFGGFVVVVTLLAFLAIAMIKPASANRALPVRVLLTAVWLVGYAVGFWIGLAYPGIAGVPVWVWSCVCYIVLGFCLLTAIAERDTWGVRVRQQIPRGVLGRAVAFLFFSGAAGGVIWAIILASLTLLAFPACFFFFDHSTSRPYGLDQSLHEFILRADWAMAVTGFYFVAYALSAVLIRSHLLGRWIKPIATPAIAVMLMVVGMMGPVIFAFFMDGDPFDQRFEFNYPMLGNPFAPLFYMDQGDYVFVQKAAFVALPWAVVAAILSVPWAVKQVRGFRRLEKTPPMPV